MATAPTIPHLNLPDLTVTSQWEDSNEVRVANWIRPWDFSEEVDVGITGVPIARAAIKPVSAHLGPNAMKQSRFFFTTYSIDFDVDIQRLSVRDVGDVSIPLTDVALSHEHIYESARMLLAHGVRFFPVFLGGDHSMTRPIINALHDARGYRRLGLIQFDAHMDVQNFEDGGPHNGTPIRGIIEDDNGVDAGSIAQIGISGFVNARAYREWLREQGGTIYSSRDVARRGMEPVLKDSVVVASDGTDGVYVTLDIDCVELAYAPGTGASITGGIEPWPLMEAVFELGRSENVVGFDIVEVDPSRDAGDATARLATKLLLTFLAGYHERG